MLEFIIFFSIIFIGYAYFGYPLVLFFFKKNISTKVNLKIFPKVSVIIAAYNESACIGKTIKSILDSNYPKDCLDIWISSDCSTDETDAIVKSYANHNVYLNRALKRSGKVNAILSVIEKANADIFVLADASSYFLSDTLSTLIKHFDTPSIGSVTGRKKIIKTGSNVSEGDGLYWTYEAMVRKLESNTGSSLIGCEGGLTAVRKNLFKMDFPTTIAEDNALCYRIYEQGYKNLYEPDAIILEESSINIKSEFFRKIRVIAKEIQGIIVFYYLFNPFKHPMFFFQNISHRICRWSVPFFLIILFILCGFSDYMLMNILLIGQLIFYLLALIGVVLGEKRNKIFIFSIPSYFTAVNLSALFAWASFFRNYEVFDRTEREKVSLERNKIITENIQNKKPDSGENTKQ